MKNVLDRRVPFQQQSKVSYLSTSQPYNIAKNLITCEICESILSLNPRLDKILGSPLPHQLPFILLNVSHMNLLKVANWSYSKWSLLNIFHLCQQHDT